METFDCLSLLAFPITLALLNFTNYIYKNHCHNQISYRKLTYERFYFELLSLPFIADKNFYTSL